MDVLLLRLIHIGAGAFWVGSVFTFFLFVQPTGAAIGPDATKFVYHLIRHRRLPTAILTSAIVTVLAGASLLVITSNGLNPDLLFSESRLGFTVGGLAGILTLGIGALYIHPRTVIVERTLGPVMSEGRPPTPEEGQTLARATGESRRAGRFVLAGLAIAVLSMATARYWGVLI